MRAAELRAQASSRNIANANTVGSLPNAQGARQTREACQPVDVVLSSLAGGGVHAELRSTYKPPVEAYSPSSAYADERGMVAAPNIDVAKELNDLISTEMSYKANAMVVNVATRMFDALIDAMDTNRDLPRRWQVRF